MNRFLVSNEPKYRLLRTIFQGIIGTILANVDLLVGGFSIPSELKPFIVMLVMAILSPIMAEMGTDSMPKKEDVPPGHFEEGEDDGESK